jgi:hypothetical protein
MDTFYDHVVSLEKDNVPEEVSELIQQAIC